MDNMQQAQTDNLQTGGVTITVTVDDSGIAVTAEGQEPQSARDAREAGKIVERLILEAIRDVGAEDAMQQGFEQEFQAGPRRY